MALTPQYPPKTPVIVHVNGKWRQGYYQGICRWDQCHHVTVGKAKSSAGWILPPGSDIRRDHSERKKDKRTKENDPGNGIFD